SDDEYVSGNNDGYPDDYHVVGHDGISPLEYGQDIGDFGPVYDNKRDMYEEINVWISSDDDWETESRETFRDKSDGKKYNKGNNYDDKKYSK
ncbi:unnamed protein product, partial [Adineta steineri]